MSEFSFKCKNKGTFQSVCKICHAEYNKKHYRNNPKPYKDRAKISGAKIASENKEYVLSYLGEHPCVDCGESDIEVLQFDHIEMVGGNGKRVTSLLRYSLNRIKEEISKCEVRCANCHVRRTRKQLGWERTMGIGLGDQS